jgi:hypothetical protein
MKRLAAVVTTCLLLVGGTIVASGSASAIIGGEYDGTRHPNVGMIMAFDESGLGIGHCSGTLVSPTVMVTAAHCFDPATWEPWNITEYRVSFRPTDNNDPEIDDYVREGTIAGTGNMDPRYLHPPAKARGANEASRYWGGDLGVLVLDQPASAEYPGIQPSPIIPKGGLEAFSKGTRNRFFTVVGYGRQRDGFLDFTRNFTTSPLKKLDPLVLYLNGNARDSRAGGGICTGDSGGPVLMEDTLVAVTSFINAQGICGVGMGDGKVRLDTDASRAFLSQYVTLP